VCALTTCSAFFRTILYRIFIHSDRYKCSGVCKVYVCVNIPSQLQHFNQRLCVDHLHQYLGHCINRCDHHILVDQFFAFPDLPSGNLVDAHPVFNNFLYVCVGHSTHTTRLPYILAKLMYLGRRAMHVRHHGAQKKFNLRQVPCSTQQVIEVPVCPPAFNFHHQTNAEFSLY